MSSATSPLKIDLTGWASDPVVAKTLQRSAKTANSTLARLRADREAGRMDFTHLPGDKALRHASADMAMRFVRDVDDVVICGIGGSALGFLALANALLHPRHNELPKNRRGAPRFHVLDNADADAAAACLDVINPKKMLLVVISKSGGGGETSANFQVVLEALAGAHKGDLRRALRRVVVITDPAKGSLRRFADEYGVASLPVPPGVGGRFSVLSPVGVFPAALMGIDTEALLAGAGAMFNRCWKTEATANPALVAALALDAHNRAGRPITVFMPYANALWRTADWFRQLWAESLGKAVDRDGNPAHVGLTPMAALGATDQHSQVQLFAEGPDDKVYLFLRTRAARDVMIPPTRFAPETYGFLDNKSMDALLNTEGDATEAALAHFGRPTARVTMGATSAHTIGQTFMFLEMLTAAVGALWNIDAFNQPGVELGKVLTRYGMGVKSAGDYVVDERTGVKAKDLVPRRKSARGPLTF